MERFNQIINLKTSNQPLTRIQSLRYRSFATFPCFSSRRSFLKHLICLDIQIPWQQYSYSLSSKRKNVGLLSAPSDPNLLPVTSVGEPTRGCCGTRTDKKFLHSRDPPVQMLRNPQKNLQFWVMTDYWNQWWGFRSNVLKGFAEHLYATCVAPLLSSVCIGVPFPPHKDLQAIYHLPKINLLCNRT